MKVHTLGTAREDRAKEHLNQRGHGIHRVVIQLCLVVALVTVAAAAQGTSQPAQPLTNALIALNQQYQSAPTAAKNQLLSQMQALAAKRQQLLLQLMQSDPGQVLRFAIPPDMRAGFPPQVQGAIEQGQQAAGVLQVLMEDRTDGARLHFGLQTAAEHLSLHFAKKSPTNLLTGSQVRVKGVRVGNSLALACCNSGSATGSNSLQVVQAAALPNTLGGHNTLVILVNFQDNPGAQPYTVSAVQNTAFTQTSNFYLENSDQQAWLSGDVTNWSTVAVSSTSCSTGTIKSDAQAAAQAAGYNLSNYSHYVYFMSSNSGCNWWGLASVGGSDVWYNGKYGLNLHVFAHEIGHNFGLYHSHSYSCGTQVICGSGSTSEYGDPHDTMAAPYTQGLSTSVHPHFNSFQKERLGWLNTGGSPPITTVNSSGTYQIGPYEAQDGTAKALKIPLSSSSGTYYYVEFRQPQGFDSYVSNFADIVNGVVIHQASPSSGNSSDLLDMTPTSPTSFLHPALTVGQSFTDSADGITISPTAVGSTGATIQVTLGGGGGGGGTCTAANPSVSISPSQSQTVSAGTTVSFTATVKDNDSSACSSANFNLAASVPSGWSGTLSSSMLTLTPGTSGSVTLQVTSPAGTADGLYSVGVSATNAAAPSYTGSALATYVIGSTTLSLSINTNQSIYSPQQTVYVTVTLFSGGVPVSGTGVNVNITKSNGSVVSLSGTTGSNGKVTVKYRLKRQDPAGNYTATGSTNSSGNGARVGASTNFTVQ